MATWSGIRKKLESDYLAESLRGHIQYFATSYSYCPDHEGRAAIMYDGKEIISGGYYNNWMKADQFPHDEKYEKRMHEEMTYMDDTAMRLGVFDQRCFYEAFEIFDNQSIEKSLESDNMIVRIFAVLDRRVGKRRLLAMKEHMEEDALTFQDFYTIRAKAEGII
jgi:deoxycytidylate deaminase